MTCEAEAAVSDERTRRRPAAVRCDPGRRCVLGWRAPRRHAGRGAPNKVSFIAALACKDEGHPIRLRLGKVTGFRKAAAPRFAKRHFQPDAIILSNGRACSRGFASAGFQHHPVVTGGGHRSMELPEFQWLNTVLGNVKNAMQGTYHKASGKHLPRYLGEFCYRFNRRFDLAATPARRGRTAVGTPPMP